MLVRVLKCLESVSCCKVLYCAICWRCWIQQMMRSRAMTSFSHLVRRRAQDLTTHELCGVFPQCLVVRLESCKRSEPHFEILRVGLSGRDTANSPLSPSFSRRLCRRIPVLGVGVHGSRMVRGQTKSLRLCSQSFALWLDPSQRSPSSQPSLLLGSRMSTVTTVTWLWTLVCPVRVQSVNSHTGTRPSSQVVALGPCCPEWKVEWKVKWNGVWRKW